VDKVNPNKPKYKILFNAYIATYIICLILPMVVLIKITIFLLFVLGNLPEEVMKRIIPTNQQSGSFNKA